MGFYNNKKTLVILSVTAVILLTLTGFVMAASFDNDEIFNLGGDVVVPEGNHLSGDAVAILGSVTVKGRVSGDAVAIIGDVRVDGEVSGDAVAIGGRVIIKEGAKVRGRIVQIGPGMHINLGDKGINMAVHRNLLGRFFSFHFRFINLITTFALGALTVALFPNQVNLVSDNVDINIGRRVIIGLLTLILLPLLLFMTALTIIGIPLIPVIILIFAAAAFLGYIGISLFIGRKIEDTAKWNTSIFLELFLGIAVLWLVKQIPFIGFIVGFGILIVGLGVALDTRFGTK